jgi:hypothetical protein
VLSDGIHQADYGAYLAASTILPLIPTRNKAPFVQYATYADTYDATNNPYGNLLPAGIGVWAGTAGTGIDGTIFTGQLATGCAISRTGTGAGIKAALSKTTRTDGVPGVWQTLTVDNSAGLATDTIIIRTPAAVGVGAATVGTIVDAWLEVWIETPGQLSRIELWNVPTTGFYSVGNFGVYSMAVPAFPVAITGTIKTEGIPAISGVNGVNPSVRLACLAGGSFKINLGRWMYRLRNQNI